MGHSMNIKDFVGLGIEVFGTLWAIYSAYENFFQKRISKIGLDAFIIYLVQPLVGKEATHKVRHDSNAIKRSAIMMVLVAVGTTWDIVKLLLKF